MNQIALALNYEKHLFEYKKIEEFLKNKNIKNIQKLKSIWRKENLLLKIDCNDENYVFKKIHSNDKVDELERVRLLKSTYPNLLTEIVTYEKNAYLMKYVHGSNFFELDEKEKTQKIYLAGRLLAESWNNKNNSDEDVSFFVEKLFNKYRKKSERFFSNEEVASYDFSIFKKTPDLPSHNDLNAANLLYEKDSIKLIDPSDEGYNDIARDIGRYCASTFFNNYDRFGNCKQKSLEIADAFLCNFGEEDLLRAKYYIGESFLSFLNFQTVSTPKKVLKKLAIKILTKDKKIIKCLEDGL